MKPDEIREMSTDKILEELDDAREELMRMRFQLTTGEMTDYTQMTFTRKKIARMMTILHERELAGEKDSE